MSYSSVHEAIERLKKIARTKAGNRTQVANRCDLFIRQIEAKCVMTGDHQTNFLFWANSGFKDTQVLNWLMSNCTSYRETDFASKDALNILKSI